METRIASSDYYIIFYKNLIYPAYKATKVDQNEWTQVVARGVDPFHQDTIISMTPKEIIQQFHKLISRVGVCKCLSVSTF